MPRRLQGSFSLSEWLPRPRSPLWAHPKHDHRTDGSRPSSLGLQGWTSCPGPSLDGVFSPSRCFLDDRCTSGRGKRQITHTQTRTHQEKNLAQREQLTGVLFAICRGSFWGKARLVVAACVIPQSRIHFMDIGVHPAIPAGRHTERQGRPLPLVVFLFTPA